MKASGWVFVISLFFLVGLAIALLDDEVHHHINQPVVADTLVVQHYDTVIRYDTIIARPTLGVEKRLRALEDRTIGCDELRELFIVKQGSWSCREAR
jgi:hypothetical protein